MSAQLTAMPMNTAVSPSSASSSAATAAPSAAAAVTDLGLPTAELTAVAAGASSAAAVTAATDIVTAPAATVSLSKRPLGDCAPDHTATERRVQPRHDQSGPHTSDAHVHVHAAHTPPSAASRLHRHALECVCAFLGLRELAAALRVSRDWLAAVRSMRRMELTLCPRSTTPLSVVAHSIMGRHIGGLTFDLDAATLSVLADRMGHLRALVCTLQLPPPDQPIIFPANLRRIDIDTFTDAPADYDATHSQLNSIIAAIGRLLLLERLVIRLYTLPPQISFAPLVALSRLRDAEFWSEDEQIDLTDAQVDQLRALPWLQRLDVERTTTSLLRRLLRQPHDLQWKQFRLPDPLDDEAAALLPQLPSLTKIFCRTSCSRFDWLSGLPNLTSVNLAFDDPEGAADRVRSLVAELQCCTHIEFLRLDGCTDLTAAQLADLLPRLPRLRELSLNRLSIDSLSFLSQPPLTIQLSRLELFVCKQLPLSELRHVHPLGGLKKLELYHSFSAPLCAHSRLLFTPPSALMPQLEHFRYLTADDETALS